VFLGREEEPPSRGIRINYQAMSVGPDILLLGGGLASSPNLSALHSAARQLHAYILIAKCDNLSEVINNQVDRREENYLLAVPLSLSVSPPYLTHIQRLSYSGLLGPCCSAGNVTFCIICKQRIFCVGSL
jgi:hypothetical protein